MTAVSGGTQCRDDNLFLAYGHRRPDRNYSRSSLRRARRPDRNYSRSSLRRARRPDRNYSRSSSRQELVAPV